MPCDYKKYHPEWKKISSETKDKAGWVCQQCDRPCRKPGESWDDFKYRLAKKSKKLYLECCEKQGRFTLTVAHLDHNINNNESSNLKALCSGCHLRYDAKHHAKNAAKTRAKKIDPERTCAERSRSSRRVETKKTGIKKKTKK